jgi:glycosyltransferase involved in cell wall biosynthesis
MKSILVDLGLITKRRRGMGVFILNIAQELLKSDLNLTFVLSKNIDEDIIGCWEKMSPRLNVKFIYSPLNPVLTEQVVIPLLMLFNKFDFLLSSGDSAPRLVKRKRILLILHDLYFFEGKKFYKTQKLPLRKILGQVYRRFCIARFIGRKDYYVLTVSEFMKREIQRYDLSLSEKIIVIPNGIDLSKIRSIKKGSNKRNDLVLITGIDPQKNFNGFLSALESLSAESMINLNRVKVIGISSDEISVRASLPIDFLGFQDHDNVIQTLCESRYFVLSSFFESFGIPGLEALACECRVAASNTGAIPEILGPNALYFDPNDASSMKLALEHLLADEKEPIVEEPDIVAFTWTSIVQQRLIPFLKSL